MAIPRVVNSLAASAKRLTSRSTRTNEKQVQGWQEDAWEMYDLVGEQRYLASTLASRQAQARIFVGTKPDDPTESPEPLEDDRIEAILRSIGGSAEGLSQIISRVGVNLFIAGEVWLAGIPRSMLPPGLLLPSSLSADSLGEEARSGTGDLTPDDLEWRALSVTEVRSTRRGEVQLSLGQTDAEQLVVDPDDIFLLRIHRPHPRRAWEADSPTRSSLPVLRELVGLTMHISAQVDSRLAGAGMLIVPQSAQRALNVAAGLEADSDEDQFTEALMEAMLVPIQDRASASALVPLVVTAPDEAAGLFKYLTFSAPLDTEARNLRDEAIRRLALGQDAPPELLLGTGGMNHWGAWLVREDVVSTHIEPPLALFCDALTTQYLWPILLDQGMSEDEVRKHVVWYDVSHMVMRPNRSDDAKALHTMGAISDEALRDATGFGEADAPTTSTVDERIMAMVELNPGLLYKPGAAVLRAQLRAIEEGRDLPPVVDPKRGASSVPPPEEPDTAPPEDEPKQATATEQAPPQTQDGPPATEGNPAPPVGGQ